MTDARRAIVPDATLTPGELADPRSSVVLWERARAGDRPALEELLTHYEDRLRRMVRIQLGAKVRLRHDSMDIVQQTYLAALPHLEHFEARDAPALLRWLATIATNQIRDAADKLAAGKNDIDREVPLDARPDGSRGPFEPEQGGDSVGDLAWRAELREMLDQAVAELPADQREVVYLRDYCGAGWEHITNALERPSPEAARQLHQRAWIALRRVLAPRLRDSC